jgi:hypothetical protein
VPGAGTRVSAAGFGLSRTVATTRREEPDSNAKSLNSKALALEKTTVIIPPGPLFQYSFAALLLAIFPLCAAADDFYLTIAGGYTPSANQASLEKNVLFYQRLLNELGLDERPNDIYFADGLSNKATLQVMDPDSLPRANRLMAEFFGTQRNLGLNYRVHQVPDVQGATSPDNLEKWISDNSGRMKAGDRLILYVSAHGGKSSDPNQPRNTTIYLWNNRKISVSELSDQLDRLPVGVSVVTFMVQCHAGGFAQLLNAKGVRGNPLAKQNRCGFFATVYDRPAAGCTAEINEASYEEYSTYFFAALAGKDRLGQAIELPDYDGNGRVSFDEAHAYTILSANTIDLPIKTSDEFLRTVSKFGGKDDPKLLGNNTSFETVLKLANPADRAVLEGLSRKLELTGDDRIAKARATGSQREGRGGRGPADRRRGNRTPGEADRLKQAIANDLKKRWPELANVLNPVSVELLTTRQDEFVKAIESHRNYARYRELAARAAPPNSAEKSQVKYERFVRVAENVILAENLARIGDSESLAAWQRVVEAESGSLTPRKMVEVGPAGREPDKDSLKSVKAR